MLAPCTAFASLCDQEERIPTNTVSAFCFLQTFRERKGHAPEVAGPHPLERREISNFDYLMYLNTLAGRTYSDLMQYPVFPWVLADYHSKTLDLTNPSTFRDLSKPMGAQTEERKNKFIQRYKEVEKSEGNLSAQCHYCTHYSSSMIVASYLVRIEPFTQIFRSLQDVYFLPVEVNSAFFTALEIDAFPILSRCFGTVDGDCRWRSGLNRCAAGLVDRKVGGSNLHNGGGSFDLADRMFHSVKSTWESASRDNMTDVRELIPEFFYFPEFLTNCNQFEFGSLQDGSSLDDVQLPPWAEGNPHKFISVHRQALESDHVSTHLHHWIDLIFGFKQHGPAAVKAVNVFHPYFYCNQAHLDKVNDPLIKSTILGFISNFGQIPKQIFTKPHPARNAPGKHLMRKDNLPFPYPTGNFPPPLSSLHHLKCSPVTLKEALGGPVGHIVCTEKGVLAVGENKILLPPCWTRVFCWGFNDFTCCLASSGPDKNCTGFRKSQAIHPFLFLLRFLCFHGCFGEQKTTVSEATVDWAGCLCAVCPMPTLLITSGSSSVICAWELSVDKDRPACLSLKQLLFGHTRPVTCLAASASYSILVSGSADRSCLVWDLNRLTRITRLPAHKACLSAVAINDSTGDIASCAGGTLYLWNINGQPLAEVCATLSAGVHLSCCCFSQVKDWDVRSLVVTGDTAGNVQVASRELWGELLLLGTQTTMQSQSAARENTGAVLGQGKLCAS
ncbi:WD repeat- and FYVE domain-containing protein 4 [Varanus komodoensis]|nr:WD repeat- and FYVE domain-containing protein 4 [Varanus komodoensis]